MQKTGLWAAWFEFLVFDLELAQGCVPSDVNQVPLVLDVAQGTFIELTNVTKRRDIVYHLVDVVLAWPCAFPGGKDHFQFLDNDSF